MTPCRSRDSRHLPLRNYHFYGAITRALSPKALSCICMNPKGVLRSTAFFDLPELSIVIGFSLAFRVSEFFEKSTIASDYDSLGFSSRRRWILSEGVAQERLGTWMKVRVGAPGRAFEEQEDRESCSRGTCGSIRCAPGAVTREAALSTVNRALNNDTRWVASEARARTARSKTRRFMPLIAALRDPE